MLTAGFPVSSRRFTAGVQRTMQHGVRPADRRGRERPGPPRPPARRASGEEPGRELRVHRGRRLVGAERAYHGIEPLDVAGTEPVEPEMHEGRLEVEEDRVVDVARHGDCVSNNWAVASFPMPYGCWAGA